MRWLDGITYLMDMSLSKTPGVGNGQGGLACCYSWGHKELGKTERLNWGMWDLSSLMRDQTHVPCNGREILNHWATREVP